MTDIKLSICIPTYNRAGFLDYLLTQFAGWDFGCTTEIVISDNGSTDGTSDVVARHKDLGRPITYFRRPENKGSMANYFTVMHRARGEFLLYLADDDLLIPDAVRKTVAFLSANPQVQAAHAPWQLYDDVAKVAQAQFYTIEADRIFTQSQDLELIQYVIQRHIFPEIAILRRSAAWKLMAEGHFTFAHFQNLALCFAMGPVAFLKEPFYRSVTNSALRRGGEQLGIDHVMTQWDQYRGGLEYFIYRCLRASGIAISPDHEPIFRASIDAFLDVRMSVAQRLWLQRKEFIKGYEILCRRRFLNPKTVDDEAAALGNLKQLVVLQSFARLANYIADVTTVVLGDVPEVEVLEKALRHCGLDDRIAVRRPPPAPSADEINSSIVFLQDEANRPRMLTQGYAPGLIKSMADLSHLL